MFITAVCVLFFIKLRWPKNKSIYETKGNIKRIHFNSAQEGVAGGWGGGIISKHCTTAVSFKPDSLMPPTYLVHR